MRQVFLLVVLAGLVVVIVGAFALGMFPPGPRTVQVQHVLPNDRFQPR